MTFADADATTNDASSDANSEINSPATALAGLRVVELGEGRALAYAGKLLAEFGADLIKVEAPGGDPLRREMPLDAGAEASEANGALHRWLNNSKRSAVVDWRRDASPLGPLLDGADIVLSSVPAKGSEADSLATRAALREHVLRDGRAQLIVVHLSDFGPDGPLAGWMGGGLALYALSGFLAASGAYDRPPVMHGVNTAWFNQGAAAALGALVAHWERARSGHGQTVDVAALDCMVGVQSAFPFMPSFTGTVQRREGKTPRADMRIMPTGDGHIATMTGRDGWTHFAQLLDDPRLLDERFLDRGERTAHMEELAEIIGQQLATRSKGDWFRAAQAARIPFAPVQSAEEIAQCPQLNDRGFFIVVDGADGRHVRMPSRPFLMSGTPWRMQRPAPRLGDTTIDDVAWSARPAPAQEPPRPDLPLRGVRIVEVSTAWAGPGATGILANLGADVIKIEAPDHPDHGRVPPFADGTLGERYFDRMPMYATLNASKYQLALNVGGGAGRDILLRLLENADVLLENYRPSVGTRLRLREEDLRDRFPDLVIVSSSGFGQSGPWRDYGGFGQTQEAASGLCHVTGHADGPPTLSAAPYPDMAAAIHGAFAIMLALEHRRKTGAAQSVDLAQYEVAALSAVEPLLQYMTTGERWPRRGNRHGRHAPHNIYRAASDDTALGNDDQWVAIAVESDAEWRRLVTALEGALPDRAGWNEVGGRRAGEDAIDAAIEGWTETRTAQEAAEHLQSFGVRAAPLLRYDQVLRLPQLWHRGFLTRAESEEVGPRIGPGRWVRLSRTPGRVRWAAANFGAHNGVILRDVLGLSDAEVEALYAGGVTSDRLDGLPRPRLAGLPVEQQIDLGLARGADPDYLAWNVAGPVIPLPGEPQLAWGDEQPG